MHGDVAEWVEAVGFDGHFSEPCGSTCERKGMPGVLPRGQNNAPRSFRTKNLETWQSG